MGVIGVFSSSVAQAIAAGAVWPLGWAGSRPIARDGLSAVLLDGLDDPRLPALLDRMPARPPSPFQEPGFISDLMATIGAATGTRLVLVAVSDGSGEPVMVLPFGLRRQGFTRVLEGLDLEVSDYWAPLAVACRRFGAADLDAIWRAARAVLPPADLVILRKVPLAIGGEPHPLAAWSRLKVMGASAVRLSLVGPDGEPAPISGLGGVKDGRRKERKLAKSGEIAFAEADAATLGPILDRMIEQRLERFRAMGRPDLLDRPEVDAFYRRRAWNGLADGSVRVFALLVDGEILAVSYGLRRAGTLTIVVTSMTSDPRWTAFSPGLIIMVRAIEWAAAAGLHTVDLSVGALAYKTRFAAIATDLAEAQIPLTPLGLPLAACGTLRRWARRAMRRHPALARLRAGAGR